MTNDEVPGSSVTDAGESVTEEVGGPPDRTAIKLRHTPPTRRHQLIRTAVLHLDGSERLRPRTWPREIAVELLSPKARANFPSRSWLVQPEELWLDTCLDRSPEFNAVPGLGQPPLRVAQELREVLLGQRVYCESHLITARWLGTLFESAGLGPPPFTVRDVWDLFDRVRDDQSDIAPAERAAYAASEAACRASAEARRHGEFARVLALRAEARRKGTLPLQVAQREGEAE